MNDITVVAITGDKVEEHALAIDKTLFCLPKYINAIGKLIAPYKPSGWNKPYHECPQYRNAFDCSRHILYYLNDYVDSRFCILVQWDGYANYLNNWTDEFFKYDYIGAPWPKSLLIKRPWWNIGRYSNWNVGNGGFSFRSKQWLRAAQTLPRFDFLGCRAEDLYQCRVHRKHFESQGCNIAPLPIAMKWSFEYPFKKYPNYNIKNSFGFHGIQNKI